MSTERRPLLGPAALGRVAGDGMAQPALSAPSGTGLAPDAPPGPDTPTRAVAPGATRDALAEGDCGAALAEGGAGAALSEDLGRPAEAGRQRRPTPSSGPGEPGPLALPPLPAVVRGRPLTDLRRATAIPGPDAPAVVVDAAPEASTTRDLIHWTAVVGGALLVALVVKLLLFQAFMIPSASMAPELGVGDRVLVNKLSYQLHDVRRGDLVVFERPPLARTPGDESDLVKRVIALPGETVEARSGVVLVDGVAIPERYLPAGTTTTEFSRLTLGEDEVWVMGDNRGNSRDSRAFGPLDEDYIIGRAFVRVWPLDQLTLF